MTSSAPEVTDAIILDDCPRHEWAIIGFNSDILHRFFTLGEAKAQLAWCIAMDPSREEVLRIRNLDELLGYSGS